jgi:plastocyanin
VRKRFALILAAMTVVAMLAAPAANSATVIKGVACNSGCLYKWSPRQVSVSTGSKVTWKAVAGSHTVTAISRNWSKNTTINAGQSTSFTFQKAGTYRFRCKFHSTLSNGKCSGMCGKVVVG